MSKIPQFTIEEYHQIAQSIENGNFFEESKKWYRALYLSILTDRCFYIVVTIIATLAALFAIFGFLKLLPISPAEPLLFPMKNTIRDTPMMSRLREDIYEPVNLSLARYHANAFVKKREDYSFERVQSRFRFLKGYSDKATMQAYSKYINPASPRSPINKYQKNVTRDVIITNTVIRKADGTTSELIDWDKTTEDQYIADVYYTAREFYPEKAQYSDWRATVEFNYKPLYIEQQDPTVTEMLLGLPKEITDDDKKIEAMTFLVTDYTVEELM